MKPKHVRVIDGFPCITLMEHEHIVAELTKWGKWKGAADQWTGSETKRKEWVGLTGEERHDLYRRAGLSKYHQPDNSFKLWTYVSFQDYYQAIEQALKEKNT